jgi:hypothetical protein
MRSRIDSSAEHSRKHPKLPLFYSILRNSRPNNSSALMPERVPAWLSWFDPVDADEVAPVKVQFLQEHAGKNYQVP